MLKQALNKSEVGREVAAIHIGQYQQMVAQHYNSSIRPWNFKVRGLSLIKVFQNTQEVNAGNLGPNWEGPYLVSAILLLGTYKLQDKDGKDGFSIQILSLINFHAFTILTKCYLRQMLIFLCHFLLNLS